MYEIEADRLVCSLQPNAITAVVQQIKPGAFAGCIALREAFLECPDVQIDKTAFSDCPQLNKAACEFIADHIVDPTVTDIRSRASVSAALQSVRQRTHDTTKTNPVQSPERKAALPPRIQSIYDRQKEVFL